MLNEVFIFFLLATACFIDFCDQSSLEGVDLGDGLLCLIHVPLVSFLVALHVWHELISDQLVGKLGFKLLAPHHLRILFGEISLCFSLASFRCYRLLCLGFHLILLIDIGLL